MHVKCSIRRRHIESQSRLTARAPSSCMLASPCKAITIGSIALMIVCNNTLNAYFGEGPGALWLEGGEGGLCGQPSRGPSTTSYSARYLVFIKIRGEF
jgi:hypothetical protein